MEERVFAVKVFYQSQNNAHEAVRLFNDRYPDKPIDRKYLRELMRKFEVTGNVGNVKRTGRPAVSEDKQIDILVDLQANPQQSTAELADQHDVPRSTVHKILKINKLHPYKLKMVHELSEDDPDRRLQFCDLMTERLQQNQIRVSNICFSDESTFFLNGHVHRHNHRYWSTENPHEFRETHTQRIQKVNVWAGILGNRVIGPIFLRENLRGERYLRMLQDEIFPEISQVAGNNIENVMFQQDGAPPHYYRPVSDFLNGHFPGRWIGRRGPVEWPARSPDLTPLDFFLWGYLKSKVYRTRPETIEELEQRITEVCRNITPETYENVRQEFHNRLFMCQEVNGEHFEHLI